MTLFDEMNVLLDKKEKISRKYTCPFGTIYAFVTLLIFMALNIIHFKIK